MISLSKTKLSNQLLLHSQTDSFTFTSWQVLSNTKFLSIKKVSNFRSTFTMNDIWLTKGITSLYHESFDNTMKNMTIIVTISTVHTKILHGFGTPTRKQQPKINIWWSMSWILNLSDLPSVRRRNGCRALNVIHLWLMALILS